MRQRAYISRWRDRGAGRLLLIALSCIWPIAFARAQAEQPTLAAGAESRQKAAAAILEQHCVECHRGRLTRSGLDLTTREGLLKGGEGGPAIISGDAAKSRLYERVTHAAQPGMPYKREKLDDSKIAVLKAWIGDGAGYAAPLTKADGPDDWWSLKPLAKPPVPRVTSAVGAAWVRTPVDQFILARLEEKGLAPAGPAHKRTLLRRVMFDLLGLPPTPEE